ncbi:ty1-copia retrotransposon protein [Gossypium australe]|uniref:Ty1-copia retrotransposon protein n=1 Tax=Gossypium australe TaxID=47621 RepID=A0A5B6UPM4_9ROSI|nr:ty1-copia retrotransposon protein [Gossypium australe]
MTDDKPIMDQVHVYEKLVSNILAEGIKMCEILQANILIETLSKSRSVYHNLLKNIKIEEVNCLKDKDLVTSSQFPLKANLVEFDAVIAIVVSEVNLIKNNVDCIIDTSTSKHFCANREMFTEFESVVEVEQVYMGNFSSSEVLGKKKILLKLTSGKTLALNNVLYIPTLRRNLISGGLLNKADINLVFEFDKLVLSRNGDYVGEGYQSGGEKVSDIKA